MLQEAEHMSGDDKRYLPRWEVGNKVLYKKQKDAVYKECVSKDISCSGVCISTEEEILPQQELTLEVHLSEDVAFHVTGKAVWHSAADGKYLIGLHFRDVPPRVQELILEYAFTCDQQAIVNHWYQGWDE